MDADYLLTECSITLDASNDPRHTACSDDIDDWYSFPGLHYENDWQDTFDELTDDS